MASLRGIIGRQEFSLGTNDGRQKVYDIDRQFSGINCCIRF
jgi:hypothetical protein